MHRSNSKQLSTPNIDSETLRATETATAAFGKRFEKRFTTDYFRPSSLGLTVSSIGIGTYLGDSNDDDDAAYIAAIQHAIDSGINLIDTAINYRGQRSERAVGGAIQQVIASGRASRQELVVCSKGGYIPLGPTPPASREAYQAYVQREFIDSQILRAEEIVAGGHSLSPRFLRYCLAKSRQNIGVKTIDVYYLHNPEQQLGSITPDELRLRVRGAFALFEDAASRGEIGAYGVATWDGLRVPPGSKGHLSLVELMSVATELAGDGHHFRAIQLPVNLAMPEAVRLQTQTMDGKLLTVVEVAAALGLAVVGSATLMQSRLTVGLPDLLRSHFPACRTDAQRAVSFARALPVTAVLVGMKDREHVTENVASASAT
jgi:aryl-alcohol dehydrogenase-like predicted oxidoreductase